mmetsp:Transcript_8419/g.26973  ORF Transcript_8419/g.26973 Transcript_8419/m.26973 type:complete len:111 (-) Transcript_8419:78-410(-)
MMMMMAAEEEVTEVKDKEDKRRRSAVKLRNKWTEEKGASSDACYITQIESNFDFSKVCYRTSANEAKVFDTTTNNTTNNNNNNNNNVGFGGGAMRNSPSSSIRSGRESPY